MSKQLMYGYCKVCFEHAAGTFESIDTMPTECEQGHTMYTFTPEQLSNFMIGFTQDLFAVSILFNEVVSER